jgi:transcriptional regulator GlxA family with amidase domain
LLVCALVAGLFGCNPFTLADEQAPKEQRKGKLNVAVLLFEGVELLDFAGPAEVFGVAGEGMSFRVFTVAEKTDVVRAIGGVQVKPEFTFKDAPRADVLVIPGGSTRNVGKTGIAWIREAGKDAQVVLSVCMGAFLLAEAGLLDGCEATTHRWGLENLQKAAPKCKVVSNKRFVDNGKIITTAGVTAGIDGALHVVERLCGKKAARWTAEEWMEYQRERPASPDEAKPGR